MNGRLSTNTDGAGNKVIYAIGNLGDDLAIGLEILSKAATVGILGTVDEASNTVTLLDGLVLHIGTELLNDSSKVAADSVTRWRDDSNMLPIGRVERDSGSSDEDFILVERRNRDLLDFGLVALDSDEGLHHGRYRHICQMFQLRVLCRRMI